MSRGNVLVTGAAGFIGSHLCSALLREGYDVVGVDNFQTGNARNLAFDQGIRFVRADVCNRDDLQFIFHKNDFRFVFHYAATVGVDFTLANPNLVLRDIEGMQNILSLCNLSGVERLFYPSSSEVYGEPADEFLHEDKSPLNARLPYAVVKSLSEVMIRTNTQRTGLPHTIFRVFNTFGPRQSRDFVVARFIEQAQTLNWIRVYGDGLQTRSFNYVENHVAAVIESIGSAACLNRTVNLGSEEEISIYRLAKIIIEIAKIKFGAGHRVEMTHDKPRLEGDMRRRKPDLSLYRLLFPKAWASHISFEDGLAETFDYESLRRAG